MEPREFLIFALASLMLNITPGSDMLYVIARSSGQGVRAGVLSSLGIMAGCFVHIFAAALGLSAVLATSALAYNTITWLGAGYLIYLGIRSLIQRGSDFSVSTTRTPLSHARIFWQGTATNVLNPKVALFFIAFLPQFIDVTAPNSALQFMLLGLWFNFSGTLVNIGVAMAFGKIGSALAAHPTFIRWQQRATGLVLVGLGIRLILVKR